MMPGEKTKDRGVSIDNAIADIVLHLSCKEVTYFCKIC